MASRLYVWIDRFFSVLRHELRSEINRVPHYDAGDEKSSFLSATFTRIVASRYNAECFLCVNSGARCVRLEIAFEYHDII